MTAGEQLNEKQRKFCENFVVCGNATSSYSNAYPDSSRETARRGGSDLMTKPDIQEYIKTLKEEKEADNIVLINNLKRMYVEAFKANLHDYQTALLVYRLRMKKSEALLNKDLLTLATFKKVEFDILFQSADAIARFEGLGEIEQKILEDASNRG